MKNIRKQGDLECGAWYHTWAGSTHCIQICKHSTSRGLLLYLGDSPVGVPPYDFDAVVRVEIPEKPITPKNGELWLGQTESGVTITAWYYCTVWHLHMKQGPGFKDYFCKTLDFQPRERLKP